jgi:O-antigen ligase
VLLRRYATSFGGVLSVLTVLCWYTAGGTILWIIPTEYAAENAGTFLNRDQYAVLIELLLPIALARSIQSGRVLPPYCLAAAAMYASVLVTASRAGTILVTLELIIFLVLACCRIERGFVAAAVIGGCALAVTAVFGPEYVIQRFQTADPFTFRREMLLSTWQMIQTKWLTGFGLGTWPTIYPAFAVFDPPGLFMNHAHNDWAEWTADGGIVFTAAIASVAAGAAWISRTSVWSMGVSIAFLHALVDFPFHKPALVVCAFLILGASVTAPQREKGAITKQKVHRHTERNISEL